MFLPIAVLALSGCSGLTNFQAAPQLRIIHTSPDAPAVDMYQGSTALAYNLGFGSITSYVPVAPGTSAVVSTIAGTAQQLTTSRGTLSPDAQYTVVLGNIAGAMQQTILRDQNSPAPTGQVSLRFLNQAALGGPLDLYLVPSGARRSTVHPLLANFTFGSNSGYLNVPAGSYTVTALPAGSIPGNNAIPAYTGSSISHNAGSAKTVILLDQSPSSLGAIVATDFDPAAIQ